ncbi:MAG: hypothetical protein U0350_12315 [Caldilineaceae bacterium]
MVKRAIVFLRRHAAHGIGHVGWAFLDEKELFNAGAVENPLGALYTSANEMGFWTKRTRNPIPPMRARRYDEFKVLELAHADPAYARRVVAWVRKQPYEVIHRNCMDATYDVLRAYGLTHLPVPAHHWEPNHWFACVEGEHYLIDGDGVALENDQIHPAALGAIEPDLESLGEMPAGEEEPAPPTWRIPGTVEAAVFEATMRTAPPMPTNRQPLRTVSHKRSFSASSGSWAKHSLSFVLVILIILIILFEDH